MKQPACVVELRIPSDPRFLSVARLTAAAVATRAEPPFSVADIEDMKLAIGEACTNVIEHAFPQDESPGCIEVLFAAEEGAMRVEVADHGCGFDATLLPTGELDDCPQETGLGIPIMRSVMDEVDFVTGPGQGTRVIMRKRPAR